MSAELAILLPADRGETHLEDLHRVERDADAPGHLRYTVERRARLKTGQYELRGELLGLGEGQVVEVAAIRAQRALMGSEVESADALVRLDQHSAVAHRRDAETLGLAHVRQLLNHITPLNDDVVCFAHLSCLLAQVRLSPRAAHASGFDARIEAQRRQGQASDVGGRDFQIAGVKNIVWYCAVFSLHRSLGRSYHFPILFHSYRNSLCSSVYL